VEQAMPFSMGTGWIPDLEDQRDKSHVTADVVPLLQRMGTPALPTNCDIRVVQPLPPVSMQGQTQCCTAFACGTLFEFFQLRTFKKFEAVSKLFIYKVTRNLLGQSEDKGAFNRTAMQAITMVGAPPEMYWPFRLDSLNAEPPAFVYALAQNFQALKYYRYDPKGSNYADVLRQAKTNLAAGLPAMFGFYLFPSINQSLNGLVPLPSTAERQGLPLGGHAVMAIGYDDTLEIQHPATGEKSIGAILFRNSWGPGWGQDGYGWIPYDYVLAELAVDWWSLIAAEYVDTGGFGFSQFGLQSQLRSIVGDGKPASKPSSKKVEAKGTSESRTKR
jgi:C1A family cysteine protease